MEVSTIFRPHMKIMNPRWRIQDDELNVFKRPHNQHMTTLNVEKAVKGITITRSHVRKRWVPLIVPFTPIPQYLIT